MVILDRSLSDETLRSATDIDSRPFPIHSDGSGNNFAVTSTAPTGAPAICAATGAPTGHVGHNYCYFDLHNAPPFQQVYIPGLTPGDIRRSVRELFSAFNGLIID